MSISVSALYGGILNYYSFQNQSKIPISKSLSLRLDPITQTVNIPKLIAGSSTDDTVEEAIKLVRLLILSSFIVDRHESPVASPRQVKNIEIIQKNMTQSQQAIVMQQVGPLLNWNNSSIDDENSVDKQIEGSEEEEEEKEDLKDTVLQGGRILGGGKTVKNRTPTIDTMNSFTSSMTTEKAVARRELELEQEVSRLLSVTEHQQAVIYDLKQMISTPQASLNRNSEDDDHEEMEEAFYSKNNMRRPISESTREMESSESAYEAISQLETKLTDLDTKNSTLKKTTSEMAIQIDLLREQGRARELELQETQKQNNDMRDEIVGLKRSSLTAARYRRKIEELQGELDVLREREHEERNEGIYETRDVYDTAQVDRLEKALHESRSRELQLLNMLASLENGSFLPTSSASISSSPSSISGTVTNSGSGSNTNNGININSNSGRVSSLSSMFEAQQQLGSSSLLSSSTSSTGPRPVRPLINHYEVLMKQAGYSAARWRMLMNRSMGTTGGVGGSLAIPKQRSVTIGSFPILSPTSPVSSLSSPTSVLSTEFKEEENEEQEKIERSDDDDEKDINSDKIKSKKEETEQGQETKTEIKISKNEVDSEEPLESTLLSSSSLPLSLNLSDKNNNKVNIYESEDSDDINDKTLLGTATINTPTTTNKYYNNNNDNNNYNGDGNKAILRTGTTEKGSEAVKRQDNDNNNNGAGGSVLKINKNGNGNSSIIIKNDDDNNDDNNNENNSNLLQLQLEREEKLIDKNKELSLENEHLRQELELMATAWKSLALKFQHLEEQQFEQQQQQQQKSQWKEEKQEKSKSEEKIEKEEMDKENNNNSSSTKKKKKTKKNNYYDGGGEKRKRFSNEPTWLESQRNEILGQIFC